MPPIARLSILGFVGGALAVLIFHQSLWFLFNHIGLIPPERPAWPLDPIPPFGVPSVISKAFWGGVWGAVLAPLLSRLHGGAYWAGWIVVAAIALPLVAFFVVPPVKGEPASGGNRTLTVRRCRCSISTSTASAKIYRSPTARVSTRRRTSCASSSTARPPSWRLSPRGSACRGCESSAASSPGRSPG